MCASVFLCNLLGVHTNSFVVIFLSYNKSLNKRTPLDFLHYNAQLNQGKTIGEAMLLDNAIVVLMYPFEL